MLIGGIWASQVFLVLGWDGDGVRAPREGGQGQDDAGGARSLGATVGERGRKEVLTTGIFHEMEMEMNCAATTSTTASGGYYLAAFLMSFMSVPVEVEGLVSPNPHSASLSLQPPPTPPMENSTPPQRSRILSLFNIPPTQDRPAPFRTCLHSLKKREAKAEFQRR